MGLTWPDIDFNNKTVNINKTYDYITRVGFKPTKTKSSVRSIDIDTKTCELLKELKQIQRKLFFKQGFKNTNQLIFLNNRHYIVSEYCL
ncbi:site-specific integrase [Bombilactobacillus apium]|uniref:hypothetical protein n=1 Tax=Bombilactobacillus apium TaxID=2675299 RepID=UPI00389941CB